MSPPDLDTPRADSAPAPAASPDAFQVIVVVGLSGSGRSTAAAALEDQGYAAVDNPPLSLLEAVALAARESSARAKTRGLVMTLGAPPPSEQGLGGADQIAEAVANLRWRSELRVTLLYLDAEDAALLRRYKETRRRHPMAGAPNLEEAVQQERAALAPLKAQAEVSIDTTTLSPHELRAEIADRFGAPQQARLTVSIFSFGFKNGAPRDADLMFDARFLANPYWKPELRSLSGLDAPVAAYVAADPHAAEFLERLTEMLKFLLPLYESEGKSYLSVAIGCTGGHHRSVYVAETLARNLRAAGWSPKLRHRDLRPPQSNGH